MINLVINKVSGQFVSTSSAIRYVREQSNGTTIATAEAEATAVYTQDDDQFWPLKGSTPGESAYYVAQVSAIPDGVPLDVLRYEGGKVQLDVDRFRAAKLAEVSEGGRLAIVNGCDVTFANKTTEHFSLEETDQINLTAAVSAVSQGKAGYPYHADGRLCRLYSAADILAISAAVVAHKMYHTTYCNHVLTWVRRAKTAEELTAIFYGAELPKDLLVNMREVLNGVSIM